MQNPTQTRFLDLTSYAYLQKTGKELITGIRKSCCNVATGIGRPDWKEEFEMLCRKHRNERAVGVFFCGASRLEGELRRYCHDYGNHEMYFNFYSEHFNSW